MRLEWILLREDVGRENARWHDPNCEKPGAELCSELMMDFKQECNMARKDRFGMITVALCGEWMKIARVEAGVTQEIAPSVSQVRDDICTWMALSWAVWRKEVLVETSW